MKNCGFNLNRTACNGLTSLKCPLHSELSSYWQIKGMWLSYRAHIRHRVSYLTTVLSETKVSRQQRLESVYYRVCKRAMLLPPYICASKGNSVCKCIAGAPWPAKARLGRWSLHTPEGPTTGWQYRQYLRIQLGQITQRINQVLTLGCIAVVDHPNAISAPSLIFLPPDLAVVIAPVIVGHDLPQLPQCSTQRDISLVYCPIKNERNVGMKISINTVLKFPDIPHQCRIFILYSTKVTIPVIRHVV